MQQRAPPPPPPPPPPLAKRAPTPAAKAKPARSSRHGFMPFWLAEVGVLGAFGGLAATVFGRGEAVRRTWYGGGKALAAALEKLVPPKRP